MSGIDYAARVQRGIALLDERWPTWVTDVDLASLDIEDGCSCMTAQYAEIQGRRGWYAVGQGLLGLNDTDYELHGFNIDNADNPGSDDWGYSVLNDLWKTEIIRRREAAQPEIDAR